MENIIISDNNSNFIKPDQIFLNFDSFYGVAYQIDVSNDIWFCIGFTKSKLNIVGGLLIGDQNDF